MPGNELLVSKIQGLGQTEQTAIMVALEPVRLHQFCLKISLLSLTLQWSSSISLALQGHRTPLPLRSFLAKRRAPPMAQSELD